MTNHTDKNELIEKFMVEYTATLWFAGQETDC